MRTVWLMLMVLATVGCRSSGKGHGGGIAAGRHTYFPIDAGTKHALSSEMSCESCHPPMSASFTDFSCVACHTHDASMTDALHASVSGYSFGPKTCLECHPTGESVPFSHTGIVTSLGSTCANCHAEGSPFAALPVASFVHPSMTGADCGSCHVTSSWKETSGAPNDSHDSQRDITVNALLPTWSGTQILSMNTSTQMLPMVMNHSSRQIPAGAMSACTNCHADAPTVLYPGVFHSSLVDLMLPEPEGCSDCHSVAEPKGFVGPMDAGSMRVPNSGAMRHDAVEWIKDAPTSRRVVSQGCEACHRSPTDTPATWATGRSGSSVARFHPSLDASVPSSCIDCHANTRPVGTVTTPSGISFNHQATQFLGDCQKCHNQTPALFGRAWDAGVFHVPSGASLSTCLPCHDAERPTSTANWVSRTFRDSPFDYGTNAQNIKHGANQDCISCHTDTQSWADGHFSHGASTLAAKECISCHMSQRPDLQPGTTPQQVATLLMFDHSRDGTGDCLGCHQATVLAGTYVNYNNPTTHALPGGDWKDGVAYPLSLVSSADHFISVTETSLIRSGTNNLVTSTRSVLITLYNAMLHTSAALPPELNPGTVNPDYGKCWHCHTNDAGVVSAYSGGTFHSALKNFQSTVGAAVTPKLQPTSQCPDCHVNMLPKDIVQKGTTNLQPMDHASRFVSAVNIGGKSVSAVDQFDCAVCHHDPGGSWADGQFHSNIAGAVPIDCNGGCHFPLMADAVKSDVTSGTTFKMAHRSSLLTFQNCEKCHASALGQAKTTPASAALFRTGTYHANLAAQPNGCDECHGVSRPSSATQGAVVYRLSQGATASNGAQWMNHASPTLGGQGCVVCHSSDAKASGSAWSKSSPFHSRATTVATCQECHGLTNGKGSVVGTNNNLPVGLTDTATVTTASAPSGVPAGTHDQITHTDINVTGRDCKACHTQAGPSSLSTAQGREWAQAKFHSNFTGGNALVINGSSGRCSNCHMNVKPGAAFSVDHSAYTATSGSTDCSSCHSFPGTGTATAPNWLGAEAGVPAYITVGGFTVPAPPASSPTTQAGVANLTHPTLAQGTTCTSCHTQASGGKYAKGYDHALAPTNSCNACHEAGSDLIGTPWNGAVSASTGTGNTRPFTIQGLVPSFKGNTRALSNGWNHFYAGQCDQCHVKPAGLVLASTGTTYTTRWKFYHSQSKMRTPVNTCAMCHGAPNNIPD